MLDSAVEVGSAIFGTTTVFIKGVGILALQMSQAPYFATYDKIAEDSFTLIENQRYVFEQKESGEVVCSDVLPNNVNANKTHEIKTGMSYSISKVSYIGQMSDEYKNSLAEEIQIKIADQEELVTIRLDTNNYGLSIKERIDLLEKCK
jgi:hypothetical protein